MFIDIFIIVLTVWALVSGWRNGFLKELVSSLGFLAGLLVAALFYSTLGEYLSVSGSETNMFTSIVAFFILWIIVPIALGFMANILTKALEGMHFGLPNSLLGAAVSFSKYLVLMSCVFNVMSALHIMDARKADESRLFRPVEGVLTFLFDKVEEKAFTGGSERNDEFLSDTVSASRPDTVWVEMHPFRSPDRSRIR